MSGVAVAPAGVELQPATDVAAVLASLDFATRQRLGNVIRLARRRRRQDWAQRHGSQPLRADLLLRESGGTLRGYADGYLWPLLWTLEYGIRRRRVDYLHVYQFERLRFSGTLPLDEPMRQELKTILDGDVDDLLALSSGSAVNGPLANLLRAIHDPITSRADGRPMTIAQIGDCLMNETLTFLDPMLRSAGIDLTARHTYFSAGQHIFLDSEKLRAELATHNFDLLFLSFLTFEGLPLYRSLTREADGLSDEELSTRIDALLAVIFKFISEVRDECNAPIVLHGCSGLPLTHARLLNPFLPPLTAATRRVAESLDAGLRDMAGATENTLFLDEAELVRRTGFRAASRRILPRVITHRGPFHPSRLGNLLAAQYATIAQAYATLAGTKVLLVDFDNTLWAGVVGEGDVVHDTGAQQILKELQQAGVLLVAMSKNDPESIRWDEMVLAPDDFVLHKINWNPKPQSVEEVAAQLDLDPASFVLIDDNPVERELVRQAWPSVRTLDPADPGTWDQLQMMLAFPNTRRTEEAARRTEMYREAAARREAITSTVDYASMMSTLSLTASWRRAGLPDVDRVQELMSRTNQFNTTTLRLSKSEVADLIRSRDVDVWVASLSDRFGDLGLVGVVITTREPDRLVFDAVVMSCRAMGFGLENLLLRGPIDAAEGRTQAVGRFVATERNSPCSRLFADFGFAEEAGGNWTLRLDGDLPEVPEWLAVRN